MSNKSDPIGTKIYTHPAPVLTDELKLELLDALNAGLEWTASECFDKSLAMECEQDHNKIRAAITKLTNLESGS